MNHLRSSDISISKDGLVYVEWDTGLRANYSHGHDGIYHVVVCDEPRFPVDGLAAVGCFVKRGKYLKTQCIKPVFFFMIKKRTKLRILQ